ncbi:hypothetical protein T4A_763 [Trichinella pseudospiralis]|uniref:Uncharacterized protein n=1 Tax=Trichinella pseudospiralis TaxID=6337 RepID=A0A0V1DK44_TRIPS|nr:hypothetical protein T4A_763 [Trichinella pseudospiralis]
MLILPSYTLGRSSNSKTGNMRVFMTSFSACLY